MGTDVVEVSPPYDSQAETTCIAATNLLVDILALMVKDEKTPVPKESVRDEL